MFKVGDKVKCINPADLITPKNYHLIKNKIYTIVGCYLNFNGIFLVKLKEQKTIQPYYASQFELVKEEIKIEKEEDYYKWLAQRNK